LLDIPKTLYSNPKEYPRECILVFNLCVEHYKRIKDIKSIGKQQLIHTLVRIPWDRPIDSKDPVVLALLNYCTLETGSRLGPRDHPATKKRPDKDELSARTWNWLRDMVGEEIYNKLFHADADPIDYPKDTKLSDLVSPEDYKRIIDSWSKVLNGMNEIFDHIALCSKETQEKWGKRVHGGADGLEKDFRANPGKYISADPNELNVLFHPSSLYDKLKWSIMHIKMPTCDAFGTDLIQKFPGHENEVCTYNMSIFNKNSEAYAQAQAAFEAGCELGREVRKQIWEFKSALDEGFSSLYDDDDESPTAEEFYTVENLDQVKPFLLEDKKVGKLYKWAVRKYDGDENVMKKMLQFATAWKGNGNTMVAAREVVKQIWALKSAIDEAIALRFDDDESPTVEDFYTVENFDQVKPFLLEDKEVDKLYKWAVRKYDGDENVMKKMLQFATAWNGNTMVAAWETSKQIRALKSAIDEVIAPFDESQTADDIYTITNFAEVKSSLLKDKKVRKLYKWAALKYDSDEGIMEKMRQFATCCITTLATEASSLANQKRRTLEFGSFVVDQTPKTSLLAECTSCENNFSRYTDEMISKENAGIDTDNLEGQVVDVFTDKACTTKVFSTVKGKHKVTQQIIDFLKKEDYPQEPASTTSIIYPSVSTVGRSIRNLSISEPQAIDVRVADTNRYASQAYRSGDTVATYYAKIRPVLDWYIVLPLCSKCTSQMYPTNDSDRVRCVTHGILRDRKKRGII